MVINEVMAATFWPGTDPIGRTFRSDTITYRIIGVSRTTKVRTLGESPRPFFFFSLRQDPSLNDNLVAHTSGDAQIVVAQSLSVLYSVDPSLMVMQAKTMSDHLAAVMLPARLVAIACALFASSDGRLDVSG